MFVRTAIRFRQPTMVLGDDLLTAATIRDIAGNAWLFAVLANRLDQLGIPSVIGDDHHGIRLLTVSPSDESLESVFSYLVAA